MINSYKKKSDTLEKFRIKAHLRSYVKDPIIINKTLLEEAISKLKKLPYDCKDPTDSVAQELLLEAFRLGHLRYEHLTDTGCQLARQGKYRGHQQLKIQRTFQGQTPRNCYPLRAV